jgi:hypothetical protein
MRCLYVGPLLITRDLTLQGSPCQLANLKTCASERFLIGQFFGFVPNSNKSSKFVPKLK